MKLALLSALILSGAARAATVDAVRRRDVVIRVYVAGTVVTRDVFRLKATIKGRVEEVQASTGAWSTNDRPLASLAGVELAAMLDARGAQDQTVLTDRWGKVFAATPIRCPADCYVLKNYLRPKIWVKPQAVLFEAARGLKLIARVKAKDAFLLNRAGLTLTYWPVSDPSRRRTAPVTPLIPDGPDGSAAGASFEVELSPRDYLPPDTEWSGVIIARIDRDVLTVPPRALIRQDGAYYLPMRVSVGLTAEGVTEVLEGADEKRAILILDEGGTNVGAAAAPAESPALVDEKPAAGDSSPAPRPAPEVAPPPARPAPQPENQQDFGDDPYGR